MCNVYLSTHRDRFAQLPGLPLPRHRCTVHLFDRSILLSAWPLGTAPLTLEKKRKRVKLRLTVMPSCIVALQAVHPPQMRNREGHLAHALCGAVEQTHCVTNLNIVIYVNCSCSFRLKVMPGCIDALQALNPAEMGNREVHIAHALCGPL
jgi:hypothetical protein